MTLVSYLEPLRRHRTDHQVVIATMGAAREWMRLGTHPLDFIYAPSAMGQAPTLGLGLALAQPNRQVIVLNGDGCLLMNLGCLVTISACDVPNLVVVTVDNGVYEVTGGQATAAHGGSRGRRQAVDYAAMARGAGWNSVFQFESATDWEAGREAVLKTPGPTCVVWKVAFDPTGTVPKSPAPAPGRAREFRRLLTRG
ncbi:MAG: thiamine pyrophosphate-dependent enzyme [Planctomycetaceae bacterium]|jgi:sulfopyruvate decarboxylase subunit beta